MFSSVLLDVAIGMSFIYLILSLIASMVQEALATLVQARAANLQRGLRSLLSGDSIEEGVSLVDSIYTHGLVRGLYQDPCKDYGGDAGWLSAFRMKLQRLFRVAPPGPIANVSDQLLLPAYIPSRTFALAIIDILNRDKYNGKEPIENIRDFLTAHHAEFQGNKAVEALLALVLDADAMGSNAKAKALKLQANVENWFNDSMDRVSGWYKKYTHNVLLVVGLVIAIAFNVDSVRVARTLWLDRDARQGMVDAATQYLQKNPDPPKSVATPEGAAQLKGNMTSTMDMIRDAADQELLPVGWRHHFSNYWETAKVYPGGSVLMLLERLCGWIITAGALSLGASFWFDTLNKFMVVRNTIKPQEKSQPEPSKD